jgi:hypothetical protein
MRRFLPGRCLSGRRESIGFYGVGALVIWEAKILMDGVVLFGRHGFLSCDLAGLRWSAALEMV